MRPLDLETLLDPEGEGLLGDASDGEDDEDGVLGDSEDEGTGGQTLASCVNSSAAAELDRSDPTVQLLFDIVDARGNDPWAAWENQVPPALIPYIQPECL